MQVLHVKSCPRGKDSNTLRISHAFIEFLREGHPGLEVAALDLFTEDLPAVAGQNIETKYALMSGRTVAKGSEESWHEVEKLIAQFMRADVCVISSPMWNFSIPYALKFYIDAIVQPGYLFRYNEQGLPVGLCQQKRLVVITSRGGDYSAAGPMHVYDHQEPYLRSIFGFLGVTDLWFVHAQPMDLGPELRDAAIAAAVEEARVVAGKI